MDRTEKLERGEEAPEAATTTTAGSTSGPAAGVPDGQQASELSAASETAAAGEGSVALAQEDALAASEAAEEVGAEPAEGEEEGDEEEEEDGLSLDLAGRILCPDGACIGVIGPGGRCKVCGTPMDPADRPSGGPVLSAAPQEEEGKGSSGGSGDRDGDDDGAADDDSGLDLENRVLCPDGACIGVIGSDGRCKVCGTPLTGDPGSQADAD